MPFFQRHALALMLLGTACFAGSAGLLAAHVLQIRAMRDVGLPVAAEVQPLLQRKAMLAEQAEVAKLQASARGDSYREIYELYVLPEVSDMPRTLAILERLLTQLQKQGVVRHIDSMTASSGSLIDLAVTVVPGQGNAVLDLLDISGVLTVNDAFTTNERQSLLALTERENPAVIAALEQFLSTDLLQYAASPQLAESQLFRSVGSDAFENDFRSLVDSSRLRSFAQTALLLGSDDHSLWPLPLFTVERAHWERGEKDETLTLTLQTHQKGKRE